MEDRNPLANAVDSGLKTRAGFTNQNRVVDLIGRLHSDIFFQTRYMLNDENVKIRMSRSKNEFALMWTAGNPFRVSIVSAGLLDRNVKLNPCVYLAHAKTLGTGMAKHPIRLVMCKTFTIPMGYRDVSHKSCFPVNCLSARSFEASIAMPSTEVSRRVPSTETLFADRTGTLPA